MLALAQTLEVAPPPLLPPSSTSGGAAAQHAVQAAQGACAAQQLPPQDDMEGSAAQLPAPPLPQAAPPACSEADAECDGMLGACLLEGGADSSGEWTAGLEVVVLEPEPEPEPRPAAARKRLQRGPPPDDGWGLCGVPLGMGGRRCSGPATPAEPSTLAQVFAVSLRHPSYVEGLAMPVESPALRRVGVPPPSRGAICRRLQVRRSLGAAALGGVRAQACGHASALHGAATLQPSQPRSTLWPASTSPCRRASLVWMRLC